MNKILGSIILVCMLLYALAGVIFYSPQNPETIAIFFEYVSVISVIIIVVALISLFAVQMMKMRIYLVEGEINNIKYDGLKCDIKLDDINATLTYQCEELKAGFRISAAGFGHDNKLDIYAFQIHGISGIKKIGIILYLISFVGLILGCYLLISDDIATKYISNIERVIFLLIILFLSVLLLINICLRQAAYLKLKHNVTGNDKN